MSWLKEFILTAVIFAVGVSLTVVAFNSKKETSIKSFDQSEITLNNGVPCVLLQGADKLALSCDWANRRLSNANNL